MLFPVFTTALLAASVLGAAIPDAAPTPAGDMSDALAICAKRGIDVSGPIPGDSTAIEGGFTFTADSDASHWVRAQFALAPEQLSKRYHYANVGVGMFAQNGCTGDGAWFNNVIYGNQNVGGRDYKSVGISYRALRSDEQLDFSSKSGADQCAVYRYSAGKRTPVGCFNSQVINCLRLTSTVWMASHLFGVDGNELMCWFC